MPGRMFFDRLAVSSATGFRGSEDKEDEKASARRAAIVQGLPDPFDPKPPPPPNRAGSSSTIHSMWVL